MRVCGAILDRLLDKPLALQRGQDAVDGTPAGTDGPRQIGERHLAVVGEQEEDRPPARQRRQNCMTFRPSPYTVFIGMQF